MIGYLKGNILHIGKNFFILSVNNVGYKAYTYARLLGQLIVGNVNEFYIHHHIREDTNSLFAFASTQELDLFEYLISVSGVGPRSALGVLNLGNVSEIVECIANSDETYISRAEGIGKRTAAKIILELQGKLDFSFCSRDIIENSTNNNTISKQNHTDLTNALAALGFKPHTIYAVLKHIDTNTDIKEQIKQALKVLSSTNNHQ